MKNKLRNSVAALGLFIIGTLSFSASVVAAPEGLDAKDLTELDLESLMQLEVTSVSRKEESVLGAAAAIYVITADDIARSPATSIPELLRAVPGLQVAQIDTGQWAVTARGFNSAFANKLLVMIDGRSIYTPLFSGVFWDSKDLLLEDIERIEVIRGPGAVMWGANAVNGIINIITKNSKDTTGGLVSALGGDEEQGTAGVRYGSTIGDHGAARIYSKYRKVDSGELVATGEDSYSDLEDVRGGFRYDYQEGADAIMISGDVMRGSPQNAVLEFSANPPSATETLQRGDYTGGSMLARWSRTLESGDSFTTQAFFDRESRDDLVLDSRVDVADYEINYQFAPSESHQFIVGGNYRWMEDRLRGTETVDFSPENRVVSRGSIFAQDEIVLSRDTLFLTVGAKLEYHDFVGVEPQPNIRASWRVDPRHTLWAATSYASRLPSRAENDTIAVQGIVPSAEAITQFVALGNTDVVSENVKSFELGYRGEVAPWFSVDLAGYYNRYTDVASVSSGSPSIIGAFEGVPVVSVPLDLDNSGDVTSFGVELASTISLAKWASAQVGANFLHADYDYGEAGSEGAGGGVQGTDPRHQAHMRLSVSPCEVVDLTAQVRYVDSLPAFGIDSYVEGDLRIAYQPFDNVEISLNGNNLFNAAHREYAPQAIFSSVAAIERSVWGAIRIKF